MRVQDASSREEEEMREVSRNGAPATRKVVSLFSGELRGLVGLQFRREARERGSQGLAPGACAIAHRAWSAISELANTSGHQLIRAVLESPGGI